MKGTVAPSSSRATAAMDQTAPSSTPADEQEPAPLKFETALTELERIAQAMGITPETALEPLPLGKGEIRRRGHKLAFLVFGSPLGAALEAAEALDASVANMRFVKPMVFPAVSDKAIRQQPWRIA